MPHIDGSFDFSGKGSNAIREVVNTLNEKLRLSIGKYLKYSYEEETPMEYTEERIKTFFTSSLIEMSKGWCLQEWGIERKAGKRVRKDGRIDYWVQIGGKGGITMIVEVKHDCIDSTHRIIRSNTAKVKLEEAICQVKNVKDVECMHSGVLFGLAVLFISQYESKKDNSRSYHRKPHEVDSEMIRLFKGENTMIHYNRYPAKYWKDWYESEEDEYRCPGFYLVTHVIKLSRERK